MQFLLKLLFCAILLNLQGALSWRHFWKGRRHHGNLGDPAPARLLNELPPDQWFVQNLDHFDATNNQTWKQVIYAYNIITLNGLLENISSLLAFLHESRLLLERWTGFLDDRRRR